MHNHKEMCTVRTQGALYNVLLAIATNIPASCDWFCDPGSHMLPYVEHIKGNYTF